MLLLRRLVLTLLLCCLPLAAQTPSPEHSETLAHIRGEMSFLASEALHGRGSSSADELVAATYVVSQFRSFGLEEAELQRAPLADGASTWNAVAILRGTELARQAVLISAHLDHLGVMEGKRYPGADDDASGTIAVMELARRLAAHGRPRRTVIFVCFGSEETGGQGNHYFLEHPPVPLEAMVANLEFEMIGRADPAVKPDELWLTGWERSNLGPKLAEHGARLVGDPHPREHFFERSDNIALARRGIVAQTVSSYGLGRHYHSPSDDAEHIDYPHMAAAIDGMVAPVEWLVNADWTPSWRPGGRP
jgi:Zn-dependent M28 family amino/carboxypeptidase